MNTFKKPRLCFVGPMVGRHFGFVTTQAEIVEDLFAKEGYSSLSFSTHLNRYLRFLDIPLRLIFQSKCSDLIFLEIFGGPSFVIEDIASAIARQKKNRLCMILHGGAMPEFMRKFPAWSRRVLARADILVTPSAYLGRCLESHGFHPRIIPNVIDIAAYPHREREAIAPKLFWMRAFHKIYNPLMAVRVLVRVKAKHPSVTMVMGGQEKGMGEKVKEFAKKQGVEQAVHFAGFLNMADKCRIGNETDIYLNTNHIDNMPVSVIEACAMGLPVVATRVGGIQDLLEDGRNALLVPDNDDEAMANAVIRLLDDPALTLRISQYARQLAEKFSWEKVYPLWESLIRRLMRV